MRPAVSIILVLLIALTSVIAQTRPASQKQQPPQPAATPPNPPDDVETLKIDTDLVTVPLIATDRSGMYITDLRKEEFTITEDNVAQEIAFFGKVAAPFHVVLLLDTSSSTRDKLKEIQRAANTFVEQLQPLDRVKVISFDDKVNDLNDFTSNRATFEGTIRSLDEEGVVVYPIRYETRATTEALAREQAGTSSSLPTISVIRQPSPNGTTPPTFPGGDDSSIPTSGSSRK